MIRILALVGTLAFATVAHAQCFGPACVPQIIQQPVTTFQPMQYSGSAYQARSYPTPLRNLFFGRGRWIHSYQPISREQPQAPSRRPSIPQPQASGFDQPATVRTRVIVE